MSDVAGPTTELGWSNVGLGFSFVLLNVFVSFYAGLGVERSLFIAAVRCVVQLGFVAILLQRVFATKNPWAVAGIALVLNLLGTLEVVANKSKRRHDYMFQSVLIGMLSSTIPISIIGTRFAMSVQPFWDPIQYVPILGMLCGSTISGIVICVNYLLREVHENRDKIEMYLAFGASRMEACRPIARDALIQALTPVINQMSVLGIIAIPGMMTGAILGGSSVQQAARLQMIIMFMISASTALASMFTIVAVISVAVDSDHRVRSDRITERQFGLWRARDRLRDEIVALFKRGVSRVSGRRRRERQVELSALLPSPGFS
ncbi:putative UPF0014-domain-containing protein [Lyophyllum shimeji]|uniref:UPF0014-domain-containing protein n=1 Tax=Lyophyllum shimeji TaxID=47721 RepID=A0A9P3UPH8_LYOSH|nr:putative UPF0014-domain-containing protein [Lyophyllum shimeji]